MFNLKSLTLALLLALAPISALADSPLQPEVATEINAIKRETGNSKGWLRTFRATYDTSLSGMGDVGAHGLGVYLPAKATITRGWMTLVDSFGPAGGSVAVHCEDANNLLTATDIAMFGPSFNYVAGTLIRLIPQDTLTTVIKGTTIAAQCELTVTIATKAQTVGKAVIWGEYFVSE